MGSLMQRLCSLMRVVLFDERQQNVLQQLKGHATVLKNCNTQWNTYSKKMELVNKSYITIEESNVKFAIDDINTVGFLPLLDLVKSIT